MPTSTSRRHAPNGSDLAFTARGYRRSQWWRHGHSHLDESEIYLRSRATPAYQRLSEGTAKELWPMWSADGKKLFYMSDRDGAENLWQRALAGEPQPLTQFKDGRLLWPSISYDGQAIVFERDFGIWKCDTATGRAEPVADSTAGRAVRPGHDAPEHDHRLSRS